MKTPKITIQIGADTGRLKKDMKKADSIVTKFGKAAGGALAGVATAAAGMAVKLGVDGVQAFIADEAAAAKLGNTLKALTGATDDQVASVEDYIEKQSLALGIGDDELRPALERLVRSTKNTEDAQRLLNLSMDLSAATGKSLEATTSAIGKAYDGSNTALGRLGVGIDKTELSTMSFEDVVKRLNNEFGDFAENKAKTTEGAIDRLNVKWEETQERIGEVLTDGLEPLLEWFTSPEGTQAIDDTLETLVGGFQLLADSLPSLLGVLEDIGNIFDDVWPDQIPSWLTDFLTDENNDFRNALINNPLLPGLRGAGVLANLAGGTQDTSTARANREATALRGQAMQNFYITSIDPKAAAKAVQKAIDDSNRQGVVKTDGKRTK
jgi:hypothetical protein